MSDDEKDDTPPATTENFIPAGCDRCGKPKKPDERYCDECKEFVKQYNR